MAEIRKTETTKLVCIEQQGPYRSMAQAFAGLSDFLSSRHVSAKGEPLALIYDTLQNLNPESLHYAAAFELAGETTGDGEHTIIMLPGGLVASATHQGAPEATRESYQQLLDWIARQDYRVSGPAREYYLGGQVPGGGGDPGQAVIELQIPVEKSLG